MKPFISEYFFSGYSHHTTPYYSYRKNRPDSLLIRLQVRGTCRVVINEKTHAVGPGDLIFSMPGDSYQLIIESEQTSEGLQPIDSADYYLSCGGEWIQHWCSRNDFPRKVIIDLADDLLSLWRRLIIEKRNIHEDNSEMLEYLVRVLCLTIERFVRKGTALSSKSELYSPYKIKQYIEKHATEPLKLGHIAKQYGISVSTASHLFKQTFGQSPMRYAVEVRFSIASERILYSDMKLEDIAEASGFRSYPYFSRAFRARYHISPSEYRTRSQLHELI